MQQHRPLTIEVIAQMNDAILIPSEAVIPGLTEKNVQFSDDAIRQIIRSYTREAGVRNLEREIGNICRKVARKVVKEGANFSASIQPGKIGDYLGVISPPSLSASLAIMRGKRVE